MMRRSFGGNRGMGGGGGGGMLRTVQRAVRAGVGGAAQEPFSNSTRTTTTSNNSTSTASKHTFKHTSNTLHLSSSTKSSSFSSFDLPISSASTTPTWPPYSSPAYGDEFDWECIYGSEDERANGFYDDFVFGSVPTNDEVQHAVSTLQQVVNPASFSQFIKDRFSYNPDNDIADQVTSPGVMHRVPSVGSELDWIEPSLQLCSPRMLQHHGSDRVYDAFHLLQTEPSVQRMVISLSSDKAVWDAVLNNDMVRELRESFNPAENSAPESSDENDDGSNPATKLLMLIFDNTKAKVMELMDKIFSLVNEFVQSPDSEKTTGETTDSFEEKLRSSFLISIMVLLIVVVTRAHKA